MNNDDEDVLLLTGITLIMLLTNLKRKTKNRRLWTRRWLERRSIGRGCGVLNMLNQELLHEDQSSYRNFLRLSNAQFELLLQLVDNNIAKQDTNMRESIPSRTRLEVTFRFLATGESFRSLMFSTRIHESTISKIVPEVLEVIYKNLKSKYLTTPKTEQEWRKIANKYENMWQFPHCLGALDGRHINFKPPRSDGSYYYNYKGNHSIVLLGMADANYKFTYVNIGVNGRVSDGGVFRESALSSAITTNQLNFPPPEPLPGRRKDTPYVIIADDAFPLSDKIMKPYPQRGLSHDNRIYNYRLSRARRIIENAFGILANRFRVLLNPINLRARKVELITLACVILHNFLATDKENRTVYFENTYDIPVNLSRLTSQAGNKSSTDARSVREEFKEYFCNEGVVEWQENAVSKHNL